MICRVISWFAAAVTRVLHDVIRPAAGITNEGPEVTVGWVNEPEDGPHVSGVKPAGATWPTVIAACADEAPKSVTATAAKATRVLTRTILWKETAHARRNRLLPGRRRPWPKLFRRE